MADIDWPTVAMVGLGVFFLALMFGYPRKIGNWLGKRKKRKAFRRALLTGAAERQKVLGARR
ncbi:MAG: hypothetical protein OXU29_08300 [Gammaproteobacteria bacterium]|nr:hypothetical protein [Gammaproteobacteria bacterium]MDD9850327.1 hypothetical protein [Gammaproteobacteria bacterium]